MIVVPSVDAMVMLPSILPLPEVVRRAGPMRTKQGLFAVGDLIKRLAEMRGTYYVG